MRASRWTLTLLIASAPGVAHADLSVVATLPDLAALARAVGGEDVEVTALAAPNQDPHYVDGRPSFLVPLSRADLLLVNGLDLEVGWLPPLLTNARNGDIQPGAPGYLDASRFVRRLAVPTRKIDRSMGDIHPGGNPHFLFDPRAARGVAEAIAERMAKLDPENAEAYQQRQKALDAELATIAARWHEKFRELPESKRKVVVYHQSFVYLWDWLGIEQVATVEPKPGIPPNPGHVARVLETMRTTRARVIAQEDYYQQGPSKTLARLAKAKMVVIPGGSHFEKGESYAEHVDEIARGLHAALSE